MSNLSSALTLPRKGRGGIWPPLVVALVAAFILTAMAAEGRALAQSLDDQTRSIARDLQCPVCQGLSVADSPSELARQMRGLIREQLEAGASREQVIRYFADRYGEGILMEPPRSGFASVAWIAPPLAVVGIGALLLTRAMRRGPSVVPSTPAGTIDPYLAQVDQEFDRVKDEGLR